MGQSESSGVRICRCATVLGTPSLVLGHPRLCVKSESDERRRLSADDVVRALHDLGRNGDTKLVRRAEIDQKLPDKLSPV